MTVECYLVLRKHGRKPRVVKATAGRPSLMAGDALLKLRLELPEDVFEAPLFTVPVERRQLAVGVELDDLDG